MIEKTKIRRLFLFENWQIEKIESWLSDMAAQGWQLIKLGALFATFKKSEPAILRYRCDADTPSILNVNDRKILYKGTGWSPVAGSRQQISIYCAEDPLAPELHTDPYEFANVLTTLNTHAIFLSVIATAVILFSLFMSFSDPYMITRALLDNYYCTFSTYILLFGYLGIVAIQGRIHLSSLKNRLRTNQTLQHTVPYKRTRLAKGIVVVFTTLLMILYIALMVDYGISVASWNIEKPIPSGGLSVIRMTDILGEVNMQSNTDPDYPDAYNHYETSWSLLVPEQAKLEEDVMVIGVVQDGNKYEPSLKSERYSALTPGLARLLAEKLADSSYVVEGPNGKRGSLPLMFDQSGFDGLWLYDTTDGESHEIVALKGSDVYHIIFKGLNTTDELVPVLKKKVGLD